ncbi:hypothetical protein KC19_7G065200 [Ceratodon purpureus]|uniref:rRNA biogenesis protein RRP36 n=1 Tax=Ceratodon purpureus TaxID=3225 RepID=A0A8T0H6P9_CERPU|nr:hypothetical protein KC19_7G065200 [Ceratodon purpureus]
MGRKKEEEESEHEESDEEQASSDMDESGSGSEDDESESGSGSGTDSEEEELQGQVADVPFEVLQQARSSGQVTSFSRAKKELETKRANKNRPMEITSKKPVPRFREVIQAPKREVRDPRFESLCGKFDESRFKKSYSFIYDEELPAERQRLKKELAKGSGDTEEAKKRLEWIDRELREEQQRRKRAEAAAQHGSKEREAVKQGKKPFYPKKSEQKKEELVEKYQELKASGKLDKFMEKRRKKNSAKDHRFIPYRRPQV